MKILQTVDPQLHFIGLMYGELSKTIWYRLYGYFWFVATSIVILPEVTYFFVFLDDIDKASDVMIFITATGMTIIKILLYNNYKFKYANLIRKLQKNVDEKINEGRAKHYDQGEFYCQIVTKRYYGLLTLALVAGLGLPLVVVTFNYLRGTLTKDIWYLPFPGVFFYDSDASPGFELTYLLQAVSLTGIIRSYGAIDSLFIAMCIYIRAGYKDLQDMVLEIDMNDLFRPNMTSGVDSDMHAMPTIDNDPKTITPNNLNALKWNIKKCVDFYTFLDECFDEIERVNSGIVFTQFAGTILIMCTSVFQMTSTLESGKVLSYVNFVVCYMSQLFVYAYFGNLAHSERLKIADVVYDGWWYLRPEKLRRYYQMTIMKAQKPKFLRGYSYLDCSLETFAAVIKTSGTAFTLLRTAKEKL